MKKKELRMDTRNIKSIVGLEEYRIKGVTNDIMFFRKRGKYQNGDENNEIFFGVDQDHVSFLNYEHFIHSINLDFINEFDSKSFIDYYRDGVMSALDKRLNVTEGDIVGTLHLGFVVYFGLGDVADKANKAMSDFREGMAIILEEREHKKFLDEREEFSEDFNRTSASLLNSEQIGADDFEVLCDEYNEVMHIRTIGYLRDKVRYVKYVGGSMYTLYLYTSKGTSNKIGQHIINLVEKIKEYNCLRGEK